MANLYRADEFVKTVLGAAIPGAQLFWCTQPANVSSYPPSPLAVAFSDPNGFLPLTFPVLTDGFGHGDVYLNAGLYTLVVAFGGVISQIYPDQSIGGVGTNRGAGTALSLQINGVLSSNQLLQNLVGQNSVVVTDAGNGTVNITGAVFQTNGVANAVQSKQNLIAGTNITLTADGAGGTTITGATQGTTFSTSGQGWFAGPGLIDGISIATGSGSGANGHIINIFGSVAANAVVAFQFNLQSAWTISKISYEFSGTTAGGKVYFGIYNAAGSLLTQSTFDGSISTVQTIVLGAALNLTPGTYYFGYSSTSNSITGPVLAVGTAIAQTVAALNSNGIKWGYSSNLVSGGTMPASLGPLTSYVANADTLPIPIWLV
jgi:hypothetical protein